LVCYKTDPKYRKEGGLLSPKKEMIQYFCVHNKDLIWPQLTSEYQEDV
jgi:hypothetical protein